MLFNSFEFLIFLPIVFLLYWFVFDYAIRKCKKQLLWQNLFVVVASYIFYGWWDWRFLILIAITTILSFLSGIGIEKAHTQRGKKTVMIANIVVNLGILGVYKYYDFFAEQFAQLFGIESDFLLLHLILPVGISFYTFQALSYSIDVYRKQIQPTHDIVAFTAFLSFFPQLVAGPIERATNLLPQFQRKRHFDYTQAVDGMRQILWGLFKKIVVADNCAAYVDTVFADISTQSGSTLLLAAVLFTFQIYGDFSGYSDIAIGTAKLFGINLMRNFNVPYFSRDIAEFWRRWHISLTTWFRDYVYIPLGGSRPVVPERLKAKGERRAARYIKWIAVRNTFVIFLLSGFWHGANWTFVLWGAYHALLFVPLLVMNKNRRFMDDERQWTDIPRMLLTFVLVVIGWIFFRASDMASCWDYFSGIWQLSLFTLPVVENSLLLWATIAAIIVMLIIEWTKQLPNRWWLYYGLLVAIWWFAGQDVDFIYFQF
ncbi:MAG: MBOAT family protein [Paludibacteraceae bacterium]|nr:MBOAT family protein [Paludibacteraceae bacterium]